MKVSPFQLSYLNVAFHLKRRSKYLEEVWGTESRLLEVQCDISTVIDDLGSHAICCCWSTELYQVQSQYKKTFSCKASAHTAKSTNACFIGLGITAWLARKPSLPKLHRESGLLLRSIWMQMSWRPLLKQYGLPQNLSSATDWSPSHKSSQDQELTQYECTFWFTNVFI